MDDGKKEVGIPERGTDRPALKYLYRHVKADIANDWHEIGVELFDVGDEAVLNTIRKSNPGDPNRCAAEMLQLWLARKSKVNWNQLLETLREPHIKLNALATKIEGMLSKDSTPQQAPVITSHPQDVQVQEGQQEMLKVTADETMPLQYQWYHKSKTIPGADESFYSICPATKCKAGYYYCIVENRHGAEKSKSAMVTVTTSPTATYSAADSGVTYPTNLDSTNLDSTMQDDTPLERNLPDLVQERTKTEIIDATFSSFVDDMLDILSRVDFSKVKRKPLENVNVVGGISLSKDIEDKIDESENVSDLFNVLSRHCRSYWNWMNIRMLEKMAGNCSAAKQTIEKYKKNIYSRKVKDVMSEISSLEIPENGYTEVEEKWNKNFNDLTIKDVVKRWDEIEKKFKVEGTMILKNIKQGCVEICWLLPNDLVEQVRCSVTQELFPEVLYLKVGNFIIKDDIRHNYKEDEEECTGLEWVQCACARRIHKKCISEVVSDEQAIGHELLCPFCVI